MAEFSDYSRITPELEALAAVCLSNNQINKEDYVRYNVSAACATWTAPACLPA